MVTAVKLFVMNKTMNGRHAPVINVAADWVWTDRTGGLQRGSYVQPQVHRMINEISNQQD